MNLISILITIIIVLLSLYLYYLYLLWASDLLEKQTLYKNAYSSYYNGTLSIDSIKSESVRNDLLYVKKWEAFIPPEVILDTVKPVRFWVLYYRAKFEI